MTIVWLLLGLPSWCQDRNVYLPSTGRQLLSDSVSAVIPIHILRKANIKLIEYHYLKDIVVKQDSVIQLKNEQIKLYNNQLDSYKFVVSKQNDNIDNLNRSIKKQRNKNKIVKLIAIVSSVALITTIISNN